MTPILTFCQNDHCFHHRVAAVATHHDKLLLHRALDDDFWTFPGGRVELGEPSAAALQREMQEELKQTVTVGRLLWVVENFFTYNRRRHHEIGFFYHTIFAPEAPIRHATDIFMGDEAGMPLEFRWFTQPELTPLTVYPEFLKDAWRTLPEHPTHIVVKSW